jgi:cytosine/adenosine deaminase-related metal-dependent hydrolase
MTATRVHTAPWVFTGHRAVRGGAVAVTGTRITAVGALDELRSAGEVVEWSGTLVPGLVNAHTHLQYTHMAALGQHNYASFEVWSEAFEAEYSRRDGWRASAEDGLRAAVRTGTTAIADVVTHAEALDVLAAGRVHGIAYWEVMAWHDADWAARGRQQTLEVLAGATGAIGLSPHAPYSLDTGVLDDLGRLARERGLRSHVHLAESAAEHEYIAAGTGPLAQQWRDWGYGEFALLRGGGVAARPVTYAHTVGVLGGHTHVAHGIYVDADDRARLRDTGTVVALCPRSNAVLGLDTAPVADYLREGNVIAVGTDSLSSSPSLDVLADVAALYRIARAQGYTADDLHARLLGAVTAGGAAAMGLTGQLGTLEAGKAADITVLGVEEPTAADTLAAIVEAGEGSAIGTVIDGEIRFDRKSLLAQR